MFLLVLMVYVIFSASAMFFLERNAKNAVMFDSIPKSMWWAVMTVTTVGYGDAVPVTDWGYVVASVTAIVGTLLMNIPLAFILNAFDEIYTSRKRKEKRVRLIACCCSHDFALSSCDFPSSHGRLLCVLWPACAMYRNVGTFGTS